MGKDAPTWEELCGWVSEAELGEEDVHVGGETSTLQTRMCSKPKWDSTLSVLNSPDISALPKG